MVKWDGNQERISMIAVPYLGSSRGSHSMCEISPPSIRVLFGRDVDWKDCIVALLLQNSLYNNRNQAILPIQIVRNALTGNERLY